MSAKRILGPRRIIKCAENSACCKCQWQKSCSWECYTLSEWVSVMCASVCECMRGCVCVWVCVRVCVHTWGCVWARVWARVWEREMHRQGEIFGFILFWHIALGSYFSEKRASVKTFLFLFCSVTRMREKEEEARVIVCLSLCLSCFKEFPCFVLFCLAELLQNSPPFPAAKRCSVTLMIVPVELKTLVGGSSLTFI